MTMTVMTDDSFLNLRGKEALVNIYYNIYNTNLDHPPIFNNCHLSSVIIESVKKRPPCPLSTKRNLRGSKITASRPRNYGSFKFVKFVLKIAPNRRSKFGSVGKMLYLCNAFGDALRVKAAAQHSSSELSYAFTLHFTCSVNHERQKSGIRPPGVDG